MMYHEGDRIMLACPDNPRLDCQPATIERLTAWGAFVRTPAAATGRFRAAFAEMVPMLTTNGRIAPAPSYTGNCCDVCGSTRMRRNGPCLLCEECGSTTGCG